MPSSQHVRTPDSPTRHRKAMRSHSALLLPHRTSWHFFLWRGHPQERMAVTVPVSGVSPPPALDSGLQREPRRKSNGSLPLCLLISHTLPDRRGGFFFFYFFFYLLRIHFYHIPVFHRTAGLMAQLPCAGSTGLPLCTVGLLETRT